MTTQDERLSRVLLDALPASGTGDWGDVQRRAAGHRTARRRRFAALVTTAVVGTLVAVAPATGIVGELRGLVQGPSAPAPVQTAIAKNDAMRKEMYANGQEAGAVLHDRYSPVIASETRGVLALDAVDGPIYLWVSPTEDGRECWLIQAGEEKTTGRPYGFGSCEGTKDPAIRPDVFWTAERPSVKIIHVRLSDPAVTHVQVEVEGASDLTLPIAEGHALGTIPKDPDVRLLVALDKNGSELARSELATGDRTDQTSTSG